MKLFEIFDELKIPYGRVTKIFHFSIRPTHEGWMTNVRVSSDPANLNTYLVTKLHLSLVLNADVDVTMKRMPHKEIVESIFNEYKVFGDPTKELTTLTKTKVSHISFNRQLDKNLENIDAILENL